MLTPLSERFGYVELSYLQGRPDSEQYSRLGEEVMGLYLGAVVIPEELTDGTPGTRFAGLHPRFVHVNTGILYGPDGKPFITDPYAPAATPGFDRDTGSEEFVTGFRAPIGRLARAGGPVVAVFVPPAAYAPIDAQIQTYLDQHNIDVEGDQDELLAVVAAEFPYELRPDGEPLKIPDGFVDQIGDDEDYLRVELRRIDTENLAENVFTVRVLQALVGKRLADGRMLVTARYGVTTNESRVPAFAAVKEVLGARGQLPPGVGSPDDPPDRVVERLIAAAGI
jgi:hypothetical protein